MTFIEKAIKLLDCLGGDLNDDVSIKLLAAKLELEHHKGIAEGIKQSTEAINKALSLMKTNG